MSSIDDFFMRLALKEAETAFSEDEVPVGAVLEWNGEVIASAHNRKESENDPTSHAELIVIRKGAAEIDSWRLTGSTLYVTKEPCVMCAGAMVNARLTRLVYGCRDSRYGAVASKYQIASDARLNHRVDVSAGILEDECSAILKKFFRMHRQAY